MARWTPCDDGPCPYGEGGGMYFCRDNCGLGISEEYDNGEYSDVHDQETKDIMDQLFAEEFPNEPDVQLSDECDSFNPYCGTFIEDDDGDID